MGEKSKTDKLYPKHAPALSRTRTRQERDREDDCQDKRQLIMTRKLQQNKDVVEALRLRRKELDAQMAKLVGKEEVSSSRNRHQETTLYSRFRTYRSEDSRQDKSRQRSHSREGSSEDQRRSGRRRRVASPEQGISHPPGRRNPTPSHRE